MRTLAWLFLVSALVCALANQSFAQEGTRAEREWYGGQTLLADGLSYTVLIGAVAKRNSSALTVGVISYLTAPAIIHAVHHHGRRAALSFLVRFFAPVIAIGLLHDGGNGPALTGLGLCMFTVSMMDAGIAFDSRPASQPAAPQPSVSSGRLPLISFTSAGLVPTSAGPTLVIGGQF